MNNANIKIKLMHAHTKDIQCEFPHMRPNESFIVRSVSQANMAAKRKSLYYMYLAMTFIKALWKIIFRFPGLCLHNWLYI
jgi:hypothetical protein